MFPGASALEDLMGAQKDEHSALAVGNEPEDQEFGLMKRARN